MTMFEENLAATQGDKKRPHCSKAPFYLQVSTNLKIITVVFFEFLEENCPAVKTISD